MRDEPIAPERVTFWSSVDAAMFMQALVDAIRAQGWPAEHRYAISSAAYRGATTPLKRIVLRLRMYIEYPLRLAVACALARGPQVHVVTTNTFYAPWVASLFSGRRQQVVHLVWDLFPDALIEGSPRKRGWVVDRIECLVQRTFRRAALNVFLGERLLAHARSRFRDVPRACIIPVGADARPFADAPPREVAADEAVDILYCGNLGSMHDTVTVLEALRHWDWRAAPLRGIHLTFHASGPMYAAFQQEVRQVGGLDPAQVRLESALGNADWTRRMTRAHVALVTMKPGSEKVVMPSKTYSALAAGQAVLAVCPRDSDLAGLVAREDCGWVVEPGDLDGLRRALDEIATRRDLLSVRRRNAFRAGQDRYSDVAVGRQWARRLEALAAGGGPAV